MTTTGFVRLLHITDLHARAEAYGDDVHNPAEIRDGRQLGERRDEAFRSILRNHLRKEEQWPQAILVTGDLVEKGGTAPGEFDRARDFLIALADEFRLPLKRVFVAPGNHDVTWDPKLGLGDREKFRAFTTATAAFTAPRLVGDSLMPLTSTDLNRIREGVEIELTLLVSPTYSGIADPLGKKLLQHLTDKLADFDKERIEEIKKVVMDAHHTLDVSALGTDQRRFIADQPDPSPRTVRIAMMHHHLLPHPEIAVSAFESVVDAGQALQTLTKAGYDLVVHGHKHLAHLAKYSSENHRGIHVYAGPSIFHGRTGCALIDVYGPDGPHDIRLTQLDIDYIGNRIVPQKPHELDRDGRVDPDVLTLASSVPREVQQEVVKPLLQNLTDVLAWRADYPDKQLFDCVWEQISHEVSEIGKRRVTFKPNHVDDQLAALLRVLSEQDQSRIRMVSDDDLDYWIGAERPNTRAFEYRSALKNFRGSKERIVIVGERYTHREEKYLRNLERVVEQMIGDGFEVVLVEHLNVPRNVARDFGIYGQMAVGLFDQREGSSRHLTLTFNRDDVRDYERDWGLLRSAFLVHLRQPGEIKEWVASL